MPANESTKVVGARAVVMNLGLIVVRAAQVGYLVAGLVAVFLEQAWIVVALLVLRELAPVPGGDRRRSFQIAVQVAIEAVGVLEHDLLAAGISVACETVTVVAAICLRLMGIPTSWLGNSRPHRSKP